MGGPFLSGADGLVDMGVLPRTDLALLVFYGVEVTDEFGRFIFGQVPSGTYILQPGFALGVLPPVFTNSINLPESLVITPGLHYWQVRAFNDAALI